MAQQLPTGTITFLFSDIEGSTRLLQALGDTWPPLLARHQELMRTSFAPHGGVEVGTEGDSFFVVFPTAGGAIEAAVDVQRALANEPWPPDAEIRVRMGLHTGEGSLGLDSYVGLDVHRAARIAAAGNGGQVLISEATRALVAHGLPDGVELRDLGEHRLKDLVERERLYQLVISGLADDFPALRTLDTTPNNLPTQLSTFLGREREIAEVDELMDRSRLVTLTGPGGTGKTRLSIEIATRRLGSYPDGVFFVPLGLLSEVELVAPTIAHEIGLPDRGGSAPIERLKAHLGSRTALLVLDNFEQVVDAAGQVAELMTAAASLSVLVTSRSALHLSGEQEYGVPPLGVPDPGHLPSLDALSQYEAVALFIERARAASPGFSVTNENAPAVAEICYRLDGLPLAIELAAARIKLLTPQAMLSRLEHSLPLLAGGGRDRPARQQTLRGAIDWSYDLLDEQDRRLFAALSIFAGGMSIEAVESVCGDESVDVFEGLASLVDKSLLRRTDEVDGEPRFRMLGTIREYAAERLDETGRRAELRERHAAWYVDLAERAAADIMGPNKRLWLDRLEQEHDNLRTALMWATESGQAEIAMRLAAALWRFWQMRGYLIEGLDRTRAALALPGAVDHPTCRAQALDAAGGLAYWLGDGPTAQAFYDQELTLRRELGDRSGEAWTLYSMSFTVNYGLPSLNPGGPSDLQLAQAREWVAGAIAIYREIGDRRGVAQALWALGNLEYPSGELDKSDADVSEALAIFEELGDSFMIGWAHYTLGLSAIQQSRHDHARAHLSHSLRQFAEVEDVTGYTLVLDGFAVLANLNGDGQRAARISGAVADLERRSGTGLNPANRVLLKFDPLQLRDDPTTAAAWAEGERMTVAEAIAYALEGDPA